MKKDTKDESKLEPTRPLLGLTEDSETMKLLTFLSLSS